MAINNKEVRMTGINHIHESLPAVGGSPQTGTAGAEKGSGFSSALSRALDEAQPSDTDVSQSTALAEIPAVAPCIQDPCSRVSGETDALLGSLEDYAAQLEDPGVSLKSIAPMIEQINEDAGNLAAAAQTLDPEDQGLKEIANQTALTARTEYIKIQRGDYLS
jgi:hypothetical protein